MDEATTRKLAEQAAVELEKSGTHEGGVTTVAVINGHKVFLNTDKPLELEELMRVVNCLATAHNNMYQLAQRMAAGETQPPNASTQIH